MIIYLMYYMIFLVRSESIELGRSFVYYAVIPILISKLLKTNCRGVRQAKEWLAYVHSYVDSIPKNFVMQFRTVISMEERWQYNDKGA